MAKSEYLIVDDFQIKNFRVLVLDRDYEVGYFKKAVVDGKLFDYTLNSIRSWVVVQSDRCFKGKKIKFLKEQDLIDLGFEEALAG